jgi:hypothetical protein
LAALAAGLSVTTGASGTADVSTSSIHPTFVSGYGTNRAVATNLGVDLGSSTCTASGAPFRVTTPCGYGSAASTFAPTFYDNLEVLLTYDQTDVGSVVSWSGAVTLGTATTTTPEPASLALLAGGLAGLGLARRRRRRSAGPA